MIDLDQTQLTEVKRILRAYLPDRRVVAFGSRVQGMARRFSDLDLLVLGDGPIDPDTLSDLRYALAESDLSIRVDVLDWHALSSSFRQTIERSPLHPLQEPSEDPHAIRPL